MTERPTIASARAAAALALCTDHCQQHGSGMGCAACQSLADAAVSAFFGHLAEGPPQYVAIPRAHELRLPMHAWITPNDWNAIAKAVAP